MSDDFRDYDPKPKTIVRLRDGTQLPLATPGARLVARIVDGILIGVAGAIVLAAASVDLTAAFALAVITLFIGLFYEVSLIAVRGQTLGKQILGIKVVTVDDGSLPGWGKSVGRWIIPSVLPIFPGIGSIAALVGYLALLWNVNRQTWYDRAAGTVVIRLR